MSYIILQNRIDSFTKPKRKKGSSKSVGNLKWPHPPHWLANADTLAEAGFYFDPSPDDKDNVRCYMCGKEIGEWAEDDDPHQIHFEKCGKTCGWASARCGVEQDKDKKGRFDFKDKNRLPTSKAMEKARLQTFTLENRWPHDQVSNHGANSKNMARAGFVYLPTQDVDDLATCLYCGICLNGWDEEDDPMEEHRKRVSSTGTACAMFPDIAVKPSTKSKSKTKPSHTDVLMPTKQHDGLNDEDEDVETLKASTSTAKTPRRPRNAKGAKTPGTSRTRSSSRSQQTTVGVDDEEDDDEEPVSRGVTPALTSKAPKKASTTGTRARTRSKSTTRAVTAGQESDEEAKVPAPKRKASSTRPRAKSKDPGDADSDDLSRSTSTKPSTRTRSKSKSRVSVIPEDDNDSGPPEDGDITEETTTTRSTKPRNAKPASHARTLSKASEDESDIARALSSAFSSNARDDAVPSTKTRKSSKPPSTAGPSKFAAQEELGPSTSRKKVGGGHKRTASSASQRGKSRAPPPEQIEEDEEMDVADMEMDLEAHIPPPTPMVEQESKPVSSKAESTKPQKTVQSEAKPASRNESLPLPTQPTNRPPLSRMASATSSTGSDATGVSKGMVKALASRYESEEPPAAPMLKSQRSQQGDAPPIISPDKPPSSSSLRPPAPLSRTANGKSASATAKTTLIEKPRSRGQSRIGSGSEDESREVDAELQLVEISSGDEIDENGVKTPSPKKSKKKAKKTVVHEKDEREERKENERPVAGQPAIADRSHAVPKKVKDVMHIDDIVVQNTESAATEDTKMADSQDSGGANAAAERPITPPPISNIVPSFPKTPLPNGNDSGAVNKVPMTPGFQFQFIPPLSKEPFVNIEILSDEELNMTVEEWIRYQMGLEYEKFKKDGENELDAFQRKAEEVRRAIEAL
ncbi:chromosome segregation protein [Moniliophthora roreri MCA 2997]|uniref:Chromosome segregation protein n=2 Tax=Moniliophthora roreri TaxID=221103 RepID=V2WTB2_MONRO|nr:chromosome segregation protein [Moniliophthora roreri MCA 2997]KAI3607752.1 chromosome segregation protein [Moniliophthora roreri]